MPEQKAAMKTIPVRYNGDIAYRICLDLSFEHLPQMLSSLETKDRRICIVTDSNVEKLYLEQTLALISPCCAALTFYVFPAGEEYKTLDQIRGLYEHLIRESFDRHDLLLALGGGVVGDMTGFAAATYLRGIRFVQVPTTLLSQVDSSIGGKTGVDFDHYKNMVGAFHQPSLVFINSSVLATLDEEQFASGMGEVLKHGLIRSSSYYEWTIEHMEEIEEREPETLLKMVEQSLQIKRAVVEADPFEKRERAILNFGHTVGHAIEKQSDFAIPHGHCVALGCVAAAYISWKRGWLDADEFYEIRDMNVGFSLPITISGQDPDKILEEMRHDKKAIGGRIRFILLKTIGKAVIDETVTDEEILDAIRSLDFNDPRYN